MSTLLLEGNNVNSADKTYERHLCEQVLELSRVVYTANSDEPYPIAKQVMVNNSKATIEDIRAQVQENMDFLRVSLKYLIFDIEALRREKAELKKKKGR